MTKLSKQKIRQVFIKNRKNIKSRKKFERLLNDKLFEFFAKEEKKTEIAGYSAVNGEICILDALKKLLKKKENTVCLPKIENNTRKLTFIAWDINIPMKKSKYDIPVPVFGKIVVPKYLLIPLVAFDKNKNRIGYGGGYYDTTLNHYKKENQFFVSIGVAFDQQECSSIPIENFDQRLDFVITPTRIVS